MFSPRADGGVATMLGELRAASFLPNLCVWYSALQEEGPLTSLPLRLEIHRKFCMKMFRSDSVSACSSSASWRKALPLRDECGSQARLALILWLCPWCHPKLSGVPLSLPPLPTLMCCVWTLGNPWKGWCLLTPSHQSSDKTTSQSGLQAHWLSGRVS